MGGVNFRLNTSIKGKVISAFDPFQTTFQWRNQRYKRALRSTIQKNLVMLVQEKSQRHAQRCRFELGVERIYK